MQAAAGRPPPAPANNTPPPLHKIFGRVFPSVFTILVSGTNGDHGVQPPVDSCLCRLQFYCSALSELGRVSGCGALYYVVNN